MCLCKCKNKSTLYSPSHPPTHICIYSHTHTRRLICTPRGQLPVNGLLGPLIFFPSARPRPVSLFDLVGCYPAKPAPTPHHKHTLTPPPLFPVPPAEASAPIDAPSFRGNKLSHMIRHQWWRSLEIIGSFFGSYWGGLVRVCVCLCD